VNQSARLSEAEFCRRPARSRSADDVLEGSEVTFTAERHFAAFACHELRRPMALQRTIMELAIGDPHPTVDSLREALQRAIAAGEEQQRLVDSLLTLTAARHRLADPGPFDLAEVAAAAVLLQADAAAHFGVRIDCFLAPAPTMGSWDLAERLVANLLDNASRYNVDSGVVDVLVETREGDAYLAVTNDGHVIDPGDVDRLFEPFERASNGTRGGGTGLGLAIVEAITSAHQGRVRAYARPEGGLQVEVRLPSRSTYRSKPSVSEPTDA
jgi:signal transduction histidine kinase